MFPFLAAPGLLERLCSEALGERVLESLVCCGGQAGNVALEHQVALLHSRADERRDVDCASS